MASDTLIFAAAPRLKEGFFRSVLSAMARLRAPRMVAAPASTLAPAAGVPAGHGSLEIAALLLRN